MTVFWWGKIPQNKTKNTRRCSLELWFDKSCDSKRRSLYLYWYQDNAVRGSLYPYIIAPRLTVALCPSVIWLNSQCVCRLRNVNSASLTVQTKHHSRLPGRIVTLASEDNDERKFTLMQIQRYLSWCTYWDAGGNLLWYKFIWNLANLFIYN